MNVTKDDSGRDRNGPTDEELRRAVPQDQGARELRLGVFVLIGVLSFILVLFWMTDPATLRGRYMVITTMNDAGGVRRGDPIQMRGVNIGRVAGFDMTSEGRVNITLEIEGKWRIPGTSFVTLGESGVFGGRILRVEPGSDTDFLEPFDTLAGQGEPTDIFGTVEALGGQAEGVLARLNDLLSEPTVGSVRSSVVEMEALLDDIRGMAAEQRRQIGELTASLNRSARGLEEAAASGTDVRSAVARADSTLARLNTTSATLDDAIGSLDAILGRIESGEGTLGRLSRDDTLYDNMTKASEAIFLLMTDIRENPKKYVTIEIF